MVLVTKQKKRPTSVTHKKRYGQHRRHTKSFTQTYWPYLPLLLIVGLGLLANSLWPKNHSNVLGYATDISSSSLLLDTNAERTQDNEQALRLNSQLMAAAQAKANNMATLNYWSHDTPSGQPPWVFIKNAGYNYQSAGENLAYGFTTSATTLSGWMNSPDHRANILDANYQDVGFGIANAPNYQGSGPETIVVAMYGQPTGSPIVASSSSSPLHADSPATTVLGKSTNTPITASSQSVSRIQVVTDGSAPWSLLVISVLAALGLAFIIIRHGLFWRRAVVRGENFIIHHPWVDMVVAVIIMAGFVLSRSAGTIM